ncbi:uncharacterized protein LOC120703603 [Panicum virgatum]|uniref:Uncharacterized protein n=1 Tax=Panicum virgatum TaxID=38727 RepID=A0A8T0XIR9_PANVG|nr:uncharacterized protein LOC120703603 [Panicum virgatum]KAG2658838.1 hypothetical protein PVAP13_1KG319100 [Panicum virgatum]
MPPLDLDTLVSWSDGASGGGGGGGEELKAACGRDAALSDGGPGAWERDDDGDPYAPAQSLRLRIGEDIDWSDVAAGAVLERDDSTKGAGANPKCAARRSVAAAAARGSLPSPAPTARRAVAVVIGGLAPAAAGKAARDHGRRRRSPRRPGGRARVFTAGEAAAADRLAEPGSPKVSCLGGVRSQQRAAAEGVTTGRRWWAWLVADVVRPGCCWNGRRERRPHGSEAIGSAVAASAPVLAADVASGHRIDRWSRCVRSRSVGHIPHGNFCHL